MGLMDTGGSSVKEIAIYAWIVTYRMYAFVNPSKGQQMKWAQESDYNGKYIRFDGTETLRFYALKDGLYSVASKSVNKVAYYHAGDLIVTANNNAADIWTVCKL